MNSLDKMEDYYRLKRICAEKDAEICDSLAERDYCVDVRNAADAIRANKE